MMNEPSLLQSLRCATRSALALVLLVALCVLADAATARHLQRTLPHRVIVDPSRGMTGAAQFAVPG